MSVQSLSYLAMLKSPANKKKLMAFKFAITVPNLPLSKICHSQKIYSNLVKHIPLKVSVPFQNSILSDFQ